MDPSRILYPGHSLVGVGIGEYVRKSSFIGGLSPI